MEKYIHSITRLARKVLDLSWNESEVTIINEIALSFSLNSEWKKLEKEARWERTNFERKAAKQKIPINELRSGSEAADRLQRKADKFKLERMSQVLDHRSFGRTHPIFQEHLCAILDYIGEVLKTDESKWDEHKSHVRFCKWFINRQSKNPIYYAHEQFRQIPLISKMEMAAKQRKRIFEENNPEEVRLQSKERSHRYRQKKASSQSNEEKIRQREQARLRKQKSRQSIRMPNQSIDYGSMI
jgi:hypothetical protein